MWKILFFLVVVTNIFALEPKLGVKTFRLYDIKRNRLVTVEMWYPAEENSKVYATNSPGWPKTYEARDAALVDQESKYPLVMMSHGNGGARHSQLWLVQSLVSQGYMVASVEHFGDTWDYQHPDLYLRAWDRPIDISYTLDYLLTRSVFRSNIQKDAIGFAGYSLGGMTGIWLAGGIAVDFEKLLKRYQFFTRLFPDEIIESLEYEKSYLSYKDTRIKAFFLMAPSTWGFNYESLVNIDSPLCVIGAASDDVVPASTHARFLSSCVKNAEYELIDGKAGHYVFLNCITGIGKKLIESRFYQDHPSINRPLIHEKVSEKALEFFSKHFTQD